MKIISKRHPGKAAAMTVGSIADTKIADTISQAIENSMRMAIARNVAELKVMHQAWIQAPYIPEPVRYEDTIEYKTHLRNGTLFIETQEKK